MRLIHMVANYLLIDGTVSLLDAMGACMHLIDSNCSSCEEAKTVVLRTAPHPFRAMACVGHTS